LPSTSNRLERLDAQAVERRRAVQQHRMLGDDLLEDVQTSGTIESTCFLAALMFWTDFRSTSRLMMKRLEELERHQLRQTALVQLSGSARRRSPSGPSSPRACEQVLAEAPLLALEHVGERLQRAGCPDR